MWLKQSPSKNNLVTASKKREAKGQFCELSPNMQRKLLKGETELGAHQCFQGQACCATETVSASRSDVDADYHCKLAGQCPCPSVPLSHADRPLHLPSPSLDPSSQFCFPASLCLPEQDNSSSAGRMVKVAWCDCFLLLAPFSVSHLPECGQEQHTLLSWKPLWFWVLLWYGLHEVSAPLALWKQRHLENKSAEATNLILSEKTKDAHLNTKEGFKSFPCTF